MNAATIGSATVSPAVLDGEIVGPGCPTVLIEGLPASAVGDEIAAAQGPDAVALGSLTVLIEGRPAAMLGSLTATGGTVLTGMPTVMIGE